MQRNDYFGALHEGTERGAGEGGRDPELVAHYRRWLASRIGAGLVLALAATVIVLGADTLIAAWSGP